MSEPRTEVPDELENEIRRLVESGDLERGTTLFMDRYGGEILVFLQIRMRGEPEASEVFSQFAEDFWRGLPGLQWKSTIRSWAYTLARNAAFRHDRARRRRRTSQEDSGPMPEPAGRSRTNTPRHMQTWVKHRMVELRRQLPADDQTLLVLRIDKGLSWNELAAVFSGQGEDLNDADRKRWAARLRQRFVAVKVQLRVLAEAEGLL